MAKARTVCKKIKKKGGGYTYRKVRILASGKWRFVKGSCSKAGKAIKRKVKRKTKRKKSRKGR
jgi:hypothetical protein